MSPNAHMRLGVIFLSAVFAYNKPKPVYYVFLLPRLQTILIRDKLPTQDQTVVARPTLVQTIHNPDGSVSLVQVQC